MPERADAARNRQAILRAAEQLLARCGAEHVSVDRVAAAAGVGKGTVFRRFGNRSGLFQALLAERAAQLRDAVDAGPAPLGPGAPPRERLLAFLDALSDLSARNVGLIAAHERACVADRYADPTYRHWHGHARALVATLRPDLDAEFVGHALLASFDSDLVRRMVPDGDPARLAGSVRSLATALLG